MVIICGNCGDNAYDDSFDNSLWDMNELRNKLDALQRAEESDARYNFLREKMERKWTRSELARERAKEDIEKMKEFNRYGIKLTTMNAKGSNEADVKGIPSHNLDITDMMSLKGLQTGTPSLEDWNMDAKLLWKGLGLTKMLAKYFPENTPDIEPYVPKSQILNPDTIIDLNITPNGDSVYSLQADGGGYGMRLTTDKSVMDDYKYKIDTINVTWNFSK